MPSWHGTSLSCYAAGVTFGWPMDATQSELDAMSTEPETDPLALYLVVRTSLRMSPEKLAAQVGHAVQYVLAWSLVHATPTYPGRQIQRRVDEWLRNNDSRKIVLHANEEQWKELRELNPAEVVVDAGHTEVPVGSETVTVFWPMRKSERPPLLRKLRTHSTIGADVPMDIRRRTALQALEDWLDRPMDRGTPEGLLNYLIALLNGEILSLEGARAAGLLADMLPANGESHG